MSMKKNEAVQASRPGAGATFARERFLCQTTEDEMIEIVVSFASVPLVGPPPRPRQFDLEVATPAGASFQVHGAVPFEASVPLVNAPKRPKG